MQNTLRRMRAGSALFLALAFSHLHGQAQPYSWGWNSFGQLGNNNNASQPLPGPVFASGALSGKTVKAMAAGENHTLALCTDGTVSSWGWNIFGQLGSGSISQSLVPVWVNPSAFPSPNSVTAVAAGQLHSLALCSDGTVFAWGHNISGELGNGSFADTQVPVPVNMSGVLSGKVVKAIAAGYSHSLVLCTDGTLAAWGNNSSGQLGNNTTTASAVPVLVNATGVLAGRTVIAIGAGHGHCLALCADGSMVSWGRNSGGQLGDNSFIDRPVPVLVNTTAAPLVFAGRTVVAIATGDYHNLGLCSDGLTVSWGQNNYGQLGENTSNPWRSVPGLVDTTAGTSALAGKTVTAIAAGASHSLALCSDGTLAAWGRNSEGQLGENSTTQHPAPVIVDSSTLPSGSSFGSVFSGSASHHSLALTAAPPCPPAILVRGSSVTILNGDTTPTGGDNTAFFDAAVCDPASVTHGFTIYNFGNCPLTVTNITSSNPAEFSVASAVLPIVIPGGGSWSDFSVTFNPNAVGNRTAVITIGSDDPAANPYTYAVSGNGVAPQLMVLGGNPSTVIADGDMAPGMTDGTGFGSLVVNSSSAGHVFTLTNSGTADVVLTGSPLVVIGGLNPGDFTVTQPAAGLLAPGATTTFTVVFNPAAAGLRTATLSITNNDCGSGVYDFAIEGTGIVVTSPFELVCAPNKTVKCDAPWTFDPPIVTNACASGGITLVVLSTFTSGSCPQSITRVWAAADGCGNSDTCSQTVTVVDTMPPVIVCPPNITRYTCSNAVPVYYVASAADACSSVVSVSYSPPSGSMFAAGTTTPVTVTAVDGCNNTSTATFLVTVANQAITQVRLRGLPDCFSPWLNDPAAARSPCLNLAYGGSFWKGFDNSTVNRRFGLSWMGLPGNISSAQVALRMKPRKTLFSFPENDTISLGLSGCTASGWLWSQPIGNLPGTQPIWRTQGGCGVPFAFDLQNMPPGGVPSLLPHMNSSTHRLDMLVQNDTVVDYASLRIRYCPPIIINNYVALLTNVVAVAGASGWVFSQDPALPAISNLAVGFVLGDARDARAVLDLATLASSERGSLAVALTSSTEDMAPERFGFQLQSQSGPAGLVAAWTPIIPGAGSSVHMRLLRAGQEVHGSSGSRTVQVLGSNPEVAVTVADGRTATARFAAPVSVLTGAGAPPVLIDALEVSFEPGLSMDGASTQLEFTAENLPAFGIRDISSGPTGLYDLVHGDVLIEHAEGRMVLSPLGINAMEPVGATVRSDPTTEFRAILGDPFGFSEPPADGSSLSVCVLGRAAGEDVALDPIRFEHAGTHWNLTALRGTQAPSLAGVEVWLNGMRVLSTNGVDILQVSELPQVHWPSIGSAASGEVTHRFVFPSSVEILAGGVSCAGEELRIRIGGQARSVESLTGERIEATGAESLVLQSLDTGAPLYRLETPEIADDILILRWSGVGGILQSAASPDGPWEAVAGAGAGEATVPTHGMSARFFRVRGE